MNKSLAAMVLGVCLLTLAACDRTPPAVPPTPIADTPVPAETGATGGTAAEVPVPPAAAIFPPATTTPTDPAATETDGTRKPAQEAEAAPEEKPMPGQNNDHSAPLSTDPQTR